MIPAGVAESRGQNQSSLDAEDRLLHLLAVATSKPILRYILPLGSGFYLFPAPTTRTLHIKSSDLCLCVCVLSALFIIKSYSAGLYVFAHSQSDILLIVLPFTGLHISTRFFVRIA